VVVRRRRRRRRINPPARRPAPGPRRPTFASAEACVASCEAAEGSEPTMALWACRGTALSCGDMTECDKAPDDAVDHAPEASP
jgi:hypothetical protein